MSLAFTALHWRKIEMLSTVSERCAFQPARHWEALSAKCHLNGVKPPTQTAGCSHAILFNWRHEGRARIGKVLTS
jgi:hypothetical protein